MQENKEFIIDSIKTEFEALKNWAQKKDNQSFNKGPAGKWTAAQHIDHLIKATKPLNRALKMPKLVLGTMFGKAERESERYIEVVGKYQTALSKGAVAEGEFVPDVIIDGHIDSSIDELEKQIKDLVEYLVIWDEIEMDTYLLPHPLLGKMTVREILLWSAYHTQHHRLRLEKDY